MPNPSNDSNDIGSLKKSPKIENLNEVLNSEEPQPIPQPIPNTVPQPSVEVKAVAVKSNNSEKSK